MNDTAIFFGKSQISSIGTITVGTIFQPFYKVRMVREKHYIYL